MIAVIFRLYPKPDINSELELQMATQLFSIVSEIPGFKSFKDFHASDGESVNIVEFESPESLQLWRDHPAHVAAKKRWRELYQSYAIQICTVDQTYGSPPPA